MASEIRYKESERVKKNTTRSFSSKQEKYVANVTSGHVTANSGATMFSGKGDVLTDGKESFLIECKTKMTSSQSISLKKEWFAKNKEEMVFEGKQHEALAFNFGPGEEMHFVIDEYLFITLLEKLNS